MRQRETFLSLLAAPLICFYLFLQSTIKLDFKFHHLLCTSITKLWRLTTCTWHTDVRSALCTKSNRPSSPIEKTPIDWLSDNNAAYPPFVERRQLQQCCFNPGHLQYMCQIITWRYVLAMYFCCYQGFSSSLLSHNASSVLLIFHSCFLFLSSRSGFHYSHTAF